MMSEKVVLHIGRSDSHCGACKTSCNPYELSHKEKCGYDQHDGCGATYTHVTSSYAGLGTEEAIKGMRPDLEYLDLYLGFTSD